MTMPPANMAEAISDLITQSRLAYRFSANSYTMWALSAALAVERAYEAEIERRRMEMGDEEITDVDVIGALFDAAFARDDLEAGSVKFIKNIHTFWRKFGYVTVRQFEAVRRTVAHEVDASR